MEGNEGGQTVSRWCAMRDLSDMRRKTENSSRTAIWVTRVAAIAYDEVSYELSKIDEAYQKEESQLTRVQPRGLLY